MTMSGHIKLDRKILEWEWYSDINTFRLFVHMILKANWKDCNFRGTTVPRGSFVSSIGRLSEETSLTEREIRTAISHLKMTGELTSKSTNRFTVFTIKNYNLYQSGDKQTDIQETNKRQPNDILTTTIEEDKEVKKERNKRECKRKLGEFSHVRLTDKEMEQLTTELGQEKFNLVIKKLDEYIESTGKTYKNHLLVIRKWVIQAVEEDNKPQLQTANKNQFNNFQQRKYDYAELEKELLESR